MQCEKLFSYEAQLTSCQSNQAEITGAAAERRRESFKGVFTIKRCVGTNSERLSDAGAQVFPHCSDKLHIITELYNSTRAGKHHGRLLETFVNKEALFPHTLTPFLITTKASDRGVNMCER